MSPASKHGKISSLNNAKDKRIKQKGGLELDKILALCGGNRAAFKLGFKRSDSNYAPSLKCQSGDKISSPLS